jgi:hypothetical protein
VPTPPEQRVFVDVLVCAYCAIRNNALKLVGLWMVAGLCASAQSAVTLAWNDHGLSSLRYGGVEYLGFGDLHLNQVTFQPAKGPAFDGDLAGTTRIDAASNRLFRDYAWGSIVVEYRPAGNRLRANVTVFNRSANTLQGIWFEPLGLQFPSRIREYDGKTPLLANTLGQPALVRATYPKGVLVVASEDRGKPVQIGFPWALDRPMNTQFPLSINTGRVHPFPDSCPSIRRPIAPQKSESFGFSLRLGPPGSTLGALAEDIYKQFASDFPPTLEWPDRRPIGALFLSTAAPGWPENPRGWLQDRKLRVDTPQGVDELRARMMAYADGSVAILTKMNAQGMITWDIEGQEFPHATSYIGDPQVFETLAPEMRGIADDYFRRFRAAGLRIGVCIRPQRLVISPDRKSARQVSVSDPAQLLIDKAMYAQKRWGATLFYVDSNVNADDPNPLDARVFKKLAAAIPDALFLPEHSGMLYHAYTAPVRELRQGHAFTDPDIRAVYPHAFTVIYTADGPIDKRHDDLVFGVKHGDVLLFRAWFDAAENPKDSAIYQEAGSPASNGPPSGQR